MRDIVVNQDADLTFSIVTNSGFAIADVKVDKVSIGAVTTYTFTEVGANHTISGIGTVSTKIVFANRFYAGLKAVPTSFW